MGSGAKGIGSRLLLALFLSVLLALAGCSDGDDGKAGADGQDGQDGVVLSDIVAINPVLDLTKTVSYDSSSGKLTIHFFLTDEDGNGINVLSDAYELRVYVSELVPGNPAENGDAWDQKFNERGTPADDSPLPGTLTLVDSATGEYTYECSNTLASSSNVIRATVRARWRETIGGVRYVFANPVNASYDFRQSAPGTRLSSSGADMVTTAACESCHGTRIGNVGHGGGYTQVKTCNHCHNANYMATRDPEADLAHLIHRIHDAGVFTELGDFSEVTFPQPVNKCAICHDGPEADLAFSVPTRMNCGSCHSEVNFATGENHDGGAWQDDLTCTLCHRPGGIDIEASHMLEPETANVSEFDVTISMTPPANGSYYVTGETPIVTVTLADSAGPVAGTVYTTAQDGEAANDQTVGLSTANLYVFGPRDEAVPVLTTNSTTDPAWDPSTTPTQAHPLFVGGSDPQVITNSNGFRYVLMAIPSSLAAGTYIVRFEGADYGAVSDTDYITASSAILTFQVKTATEEAKVSGNACLNCHGDTIMHLEGAHPHHAPFDTDHCLGCHDLSGNYAEYIGNRVHAVHRASATGDLHGSSRDWSEVTFPQEINNCTICHTNDDAEIPVWRIPSMPLCGGCHGVDPDADPDNFPNVDPERINQEAGAAQHMIANGGEADVTKPRPTQLCLVCHGEDRIADPFNTHELIRFRDLPDDPNE